MPAERRRWRRRNVLLICGADGAERHDRQVSYIYIYIYMSVQSLCMC
jgi:hypothetical protein